MAECCAVLKALLQAAEELVPAALRREFAEDVLAAQGMIFTERRAIRRNVHLLFQQGIEVLHLTPECQAPMCFVCRSLCLL